MQKIQSHSLSRTGGTGAGRGSGVREFHELILQKSDPFLKHIRFREMLRGIRVDSKEELEKRIYQYFDEINAVPVIYHWKYKKDEISQDEARAV